MARRPTASAQDAAVRRRRVTDSVAAADLDAAVFASEANFAYLTGYSSASWAMTARPLALVVHDGDCTAVVSSLEAEPLGSACPWLEIVPYTHPIVRRHAEGVTLGDFAGAAATAIGDLLGRRPGGRIGIEASVPSGSGLPYLTLRALAECVGAELVDVAPLIWRLRQTKTAYELDRLEHAGGALGRLYELFAESAAPGMTERELHGIVRRASGDVDLDRLGFSIVIAGRSPGEGLPGDRVWRHGELLLLDTCIVADGYWADFCRHFAAGDADESQARDYDRLVQALRAGRAACGPGVTTEQVAEAIAAHLPRVSGRRPFNPGRLGHGIGLDLAEPPSLAPGDDTVLRAGMTLTVEPSASYAAGHMEAEEMVAITAEGHRLISPPFPGELPVVG